MAEFFTADLHHNHEYVSNLRREKFGHDYTIEDLARFYQDTMKPGDRLYILGDLTSGRTEQGWLYVLDTLSKLSCQNGVETVVILGNHDQPHPSHRSGWKLLKWQLPMVYITTGAEIRIAGTRAILSHFPYNGDHEGSPDRHVRWRPQDDGLPIIHGHTHSTRMFSRSNKGTLQVCVSLEACDMRPVSKDYLTDLMRVELARG